MVSYNPVSGDLTADFSALPRLANDNGVYDGVYRCHLLEKQALGSTLKINVFIDHSILDIFVNDKWATSIRVFPTESDADGIEAYSLSATTVKELKAWVLDADSASSGIETVTTEAIDVDGEFVNVYNTLGVLLRSNVSREIATENLPNGIYIVGNKKVLVK